MYEGLGQALPGKAFDQAFRRKAIMWRLRATGIPVRWAAKMACDAIGGPRLFGLLIGSIKGSSREITHCQ